MTDKCYRALGVDGRVYEGRYFFEEGHSYILSNDGIHMIRFETLEKENNDMIY